MIKRKNGGNIRKRAKSATRVVKQRAGTARRVRRQRNLNSSNFNVIDAPVARSVRTVTRQPNVRSFMKGGMRSTNIRHAELINTALAGSVNWTLQSTYQLNPGIAATFPWLAPQAAQWEQYRCNKLIFHYVPIAATSTAGEIILSPNYDSSDPPPTTETQAVDNVGSVADSCWAKFSCPLDVQAMMALGPRRFVRQSAVAGDIKTFDVGRLYVSSSNQSGTSTVGKIWVEYDFDFYTPQNDPSTATLPLYTSMYNKATDQTYTTGVGAAQNWDAATYDPIGFGAAASGVFTPPAGVYRIHALGSYDDSASETFQALIEFQKNGANLTTRSRSIGSSPALASDYINLSVDGVVVFNGTDTFRLLTTLTGAAGTLSAAGTTMQLVVSLA